MGGSGRREGVQGSAAPLPPGRAPSMVDLEKAMAMSVIGSITVAQIHLLVLSSFTFV